MPVTVNSKIAETTFGNAYFHLRIHSTPFSPPRNVPGPKKFDAGDPLEVGSAKNPPKIGPITAPKLKVRGGIRNTREWYLGCPMLIKICLYGGCGAHISTPGGPSRSWNLLLINHGLRNHSPQNSNICVHQPCKTSRNHKPAVALTKSKNDVRNRG